MGLFDFFKKRQPNKNNNLEKENIGTPQDDNKLAWKSDNKEKALLAIKEETDQNKLSEIVQNATLDYVRTTALDKISDQSVLENIALNDKTGWVRSLATEKLNNQFVIEYIAKNDKYDFARKSAVEKLNDQSIIADIAKNDEYWEVRVAAVKRLSDQNMLVDVVQNSRSCISILREDMRDSILFMAAKKLTDLNLAQKVFFSIAKNSMNYKNMRKEAIEILTNTDMLLEITNGEESKYLYEWETKYDDGSYFTHILDLREIARERLEELRKIEEFKYKASTFDEKKSLKLVSDYIDENPMQKFSKEDMEMMKPFFAELFMWYKNNTEGKPLANECSRCGCRIYDDDLIFLSGSGRLFCKDCGLRYVISNLSDWHYYLGDIVAGIGFVPMSIQKKGLELQEKMTMERESKNKGNASR